MSDELVSLTAAVAILRHGNGTVKERLRDACAHLWVAMEDPDIWPDALLDRANHIVDKILENSALGDPVKKMNEPTARYVAAEIIRLAADMEAARN